MRMAILGLLTFIVTAVASAADSGLEVPGGTAVYVLVESMNKDAKAIGLTEEFIASKVELQLRKNGIPVGTKADSYASGIYLYVNCGVTGRAFALSIDFNRLVFYRVGGDTHSVTASTYHKSGQGTHGSDNRYVIEALTDLVDLFSNDFLKSNQTKIRSNKSDASYGK